MGFCWYYELWMRPHDLNEADAWREQLLEQLPHYNSRSQSDNMLSNGMLSNLPVSSSSEHTERVKIGRRG